MKKSNRFLALLTALIMIVCVMPFEAFATTAITSISVPVNETYLTRDRQDGAETYNDTTYSKYYYQSESYTPVFYDTLTARTSSGDVELTGVKWICDGFDITKNGTYTFTIDSSTIGSYSVSDSVIEQAKITVHIVDQLVTKTGANILTNGLPVKAAMVDKTYMRIFDLTGCVKLPIFNLAGSYIFTNALTAAKVSLFAGACKESLNADSYIYVDACTLLAVYGGGYGSGATFTGSTTVVVNNSTIKNIYAGGANSDSSAQFDITLDGTTSVTESLYAAASNGNYSGRVKATLSDNARIAQYVSSNNLTLYVSDSYKFDSSAVFSSGASIYVNSVLSTLASSVNVDTSDINVAKGTAASAISFPTHATAIVGGTTVTLENISWVCDDYSSASDGIYTFSIKLPSGYVLDPENETPTINVYVGNFSSVTISALNIQETATYLPIGYDGEISFYPTVEATALYGSDKQTVYLENLKWTSSDFNIAKAGIYTFKIDPTSINSKYSVSSTLLSTYSISVRVIDRVPELSQGIIFANALPITIYAGEQDTYNVCDLTGSVTFFENVISSTPLCGGGESLCTNTNITVVSGHISTVYGGGIADAEAASITILGGTVDTIYPYEHSGMGTVKNGTTLTLPTTLVSHIKYADKDSKFITVNGTNMSKYQNISATKIDNSILAMGVPCIVKQVKGETYLYRANSNTLLYPDAITYMNLYGGTADSDITTTNVTVESGIISTLYAGSSYCNVTDSVTYVQNGGVVRFSVFTGSLHANADKIFVEFNDGYIGKAATLGGNYATVGSASDTERTVIKAVMNGGATQGFTLGINSAADESAVYGNIDFTMNDGKCTNIYAGSKTTAVNGDVYATINGGSVQGTIYQNGGSGTVSGHTYLSIYKEFLTSDISINDPNGITVVKNTNSYALTLPTCSANADNVYNTTTDGGNLTIRVLEMRLADEPKGTVMSTKTGDCNVVTFPNGEIMVIDTGLQSAAQSVLAELEKLGITSIDYLVLTHYHTDHVECTDDIMNKIPVKNVFLPNYKLLGNTMFNLVQTAIATQPECKVKYLSRGDCFNIGDVKIDVFNPNTNGETLSSYTEAEANNLSMVLKMTYKNTSALFTGDAYEAIETEITELYASELKSDYLKVPHHGITSSSYYGFINAVSPAIATISNLQPESATVTSTEYALKNINEIPYVLDVGTYGAIKVTLDGKQVSYKSVYTPVQSSTGFSDVKSDAWYSDSVKSVVEKGLFAGTSATTFEPNSNMTRAMFVTVLARLAGADTTKYTNTFSDVSNNTWYTGSVAWASSNHIAQGVGSNNFAPNASITREEICAMLARYAEFAGISLDSTATVTFSDSAQISAWATTSVAAMQQAGLVMGFENNMFQPKGNATRAQVAAIIIRLCDLK